MRRRHHRHQPHDHRTHYDRPGQRYLSDHQERAPHPGWQRAGVSVLRWYALAIGVGLVLIIVLTALRAALPVVILAAAAIYVAIQVSRRNKPPSGGHRAGRGSAD